MKLDERLHEAFDAERAGVNPPDVDALRYAGERRRRQHDRIVIGVVALLVVLGLTGLLATRGGELDQPTVVAGPTEDPDRAGEQGLDPNAIPLSPIFSVGLVEPRGKVGLVVGFDGHCPAGPENSVAQTPETITVTVTCSDGSPPVKGDPPSATRTLMQLKVPLGDRVVIDGSTGERLTEGRESEIGPTPTTP